MLLHGLARTRHAMRKMERQLQKAGYITANFTYPSTRHPVETLTEYAIPPAIEYCQDQGAQKIHFVTHSLGGILLRFYLQHLTPTTVDIGRIVMLAPPNHGSEIVDKLGNWILFGLFNGPAGPQLGTDLNSMPNQLGAIVHEAGIITGNRRLDPFAWLIPGESDGKVSVLSAKLEGMQDFLILPVSHTFLMNDISVIEQTLYFLEYGRFQRS
ncbi:MAG: alpha/beta hydrolase [Pseudomonadota bacterium]